MLSVYLSLTKRSLKDPHATSVKCKSKKKKKPDVSGLLFYEDRLIAESFICCIAFVAVSLLSEEKASIAHPYFKVKSKD